VTLLHGLQLLLLLGVAALVIERVRTLSYRAALDAGPFRRALVRLIRAGQLERAEQLVAAARPAWVAETIWPLFDPEHDDDERLVDVDDRLLQLRADAAQGLRTVRIAASIASALGFIGAAIELWWVFHGDHGLLRLEAGLVESIGLNRAVLSIALGMAASSLGLGTFGALRGVARELVADARRLVVAVEEAMAAEALEPASRASDETA
jgi:hypothetical protein